MRAPIGNSCRERVEWLGFICVVILTCVGCGGGGSKPSESPATPTKTAQQQEQVIQRNLKNALESLQPDRFGVSSDADRSIASLNDWADGARKRAESEGRRWTPHHTGRLLESLPKDWLSQINLERFVVRDASFIRDAVWANSIATIVTSKSENDLERVVALFEFVVRNLELVPSGDERIPMALFEKVMLGRGTADDRAWLFAELLRQRQIDCVVLSPRRRESDDRRWNLVGVLFEKDVYLFDPYLGMPVPADIDQPETALPRRPATLREVQANSEILAAMNRDTGGEFPVTVETLTSARAELICHTAWMSSRMRLLQHELSGELQTVVSDPLDDTDDVPGLWNRVAQNRAATWKEEDLALWTYPERHLEATQHLTDELQKRLAKLIQPLGAPRIIMQIDRKEDQEPELIFGRPLRHLMKARIAQLRGEWADASPGYLAARLYEIDPPTSKEIPFGVDDKRMARGFIAQKYPQIKGLHESAADHACFWLIQCQADQHRTNATVKQAIQYLEQFSSGTWTEAAKSLLAIGLARQAELGKPEDAAERWSDAIKAAESIDSDHPSATGHQLLIARWKRFHQASVKSKKMTTDEN